MRLGASRVTMVAAVATLYAREVQAQPYTLQKLYGGKTFFDEWIFFDETDPSHGLVNYVKRDQAFRDGLAFWNIDGIPGIQAEHWTTTAVGTTRNSVRLHSLDVYNHGLFIVDLALMPWGCGVWPVWTLGYGAVWPTLGEIDIVEGIEAVTNNRYTLQAQLERIGARASANPKRNSHTTPGCNVAPIRGGDAGTATWQPCDSSTGGSGCSIDSPSNLSYGEAFNAGGGGVFAMLWEAGGISFWDWPRSRVPSDIKGHAPDPTKWGASSAFFSNESCDIDRFFKDQQLVMNVNLCGDWAAGSYAQYPYCPGTCAEVIADPANLFNAIFLVHNISVYQPSSGPVTAARRVANTTTKQMGQGAGGLVGVNAVGRRSIVPGGAAFMVIAVALCSL